MSLSNTERVRYMYRSINGLMEVRRAWMADAAVSDCDRGRHQHLFDTIGDMWHAFLGGQSNGLHWILWSSATSTICTDTPTTPWEVAITETLEDAAPKDLRTCAQLRDQPFDGRGMANIATFLRRSGHASTSYVYRAYTLVEDLLYPLRRYNDEFLQKYAELSKLVSGFMGDAYAVFRNEDTAKAYVLFEILKKLYGSMYPYHKGCGDVVADIADSQYLHHHIHECMEWRMADLVSLHIKLERAIASADADGRHAQHTDNLKMQARLMALLECHTPLCEHPHYRKEIIAAVRKSQLRRCVPEMISRMDTLTIAYVASGAKRRAERQAEQRDNCLNAYGFAGYELATGQLG